MKQTLKLSFLLALLVLNLAFAEKKKERDEIQIIPIGKSVLSPEQANAASSPWLPRNLENATSQYKVAEFFKNGFVLFAGGSSTAPMLGNYKGFYSKDSGKSFTKFSFPNFQSSATSTSLRFAGITSWGDSVMINADYAGYIIRSANWGVKWDTVSTQYGSGAFYDGVKFISRDTVIAYGDAVDSTMYITRSTNRGATWSRVAVSAKLTSDFSSYVFASAGSKTIAFFGNNVWMGAYIGSGTTTNAPGILKSTDAGLTWSFYKATNLAPKLKYSIVNMSFKDANVGYALASNNYVLSLHKTTDGGQTWSDTISVGGGAANVLTQQPAQVQSLPGTSVVFLSGFDGTNPASWKSTDDGATWTKLVTPPNTGTQASLSQISFISETVGFGAGIRQVLQYSPTVEVTFLVNTTTVPDTLKSTSTVQMRGDDGNLLRWDGGSSIRFSNITNPSGSSDFWQVKARFKLGQTFPYKIFTNVNANVGAGHTQEHNGWEGNLSPTNDRMLTVGQNDTTIKLQFVNGSPTSQPYFWRPYVETDSLEIRFRVNMANVEDFNPATMKMGVRGSQAPLEWGKSFFLTREQNDGNNPTRYAGGNFWSGTIKVPIKPDTIKVGDTLIVYYKFVQHLNSHTPTDNPVKWEDGIVRTNTFDIEPGGGSNPARIFRLLRGTQDTTLYWKWWANQGVKPPVGLDTAVVTFRVNMSNAIAKNSYVIGDTVQVRHGFANSGKTVRTVNLVKQGLTNFFQATDTVYNTKVGATPLANLVYQYYLVKDGIDLREVYYNFNYTGADVSLAERRLLAMTAKTLTVQDTSSNLSVVNRQPFWRNTRKLARVVDVTFTVDLRPAYWQVSKGDTLFDIQGPWNITKSLRDSIWKWGVSINGPAVGGWATWGASLWVDPTRIMYDNGTNGDLVANDRIYSRIYRFGPDSVANSRNLVGQEFKFGIRGGDNEGGKGGFGNNHIENINDAASTTTIDNQFGSINPLYYNNWNFQTRTPITNVLDENSTIPVVYELAQNYPNPFNPSTSIKYSIPTESRVTLKIFNLLGQEVATVVNETLAAGKYTATFNAGNLASGVYIYRIEAGSFTSVKKMMLLK